MRLFDAYLCIDWSANNQPKTGKDSIWIAEATTTGRKLTWRFPDRGCYNPPTRATAVRILRESLATHMSQGRRVLVCFDFAYGYPDCGEFRQIAPSSLEFARYVATLLEDRADNRSNRFEVADHLNGIVRDPSGEGPFWGHPSPWRNPPLRCLKPTKPTNWSSRSELREFRIVESRMKRVGLRPFSAWQLFGNGSVGSQALLGLPRVLELKERYPEVSVIWPFETGWTETVPRSKDGYLGFSANRFTDLFGAPIGTRTKKVGRNYLRCIEASVWGVDWSAIMKSFQSPNFSQVPSRSYSREIRSPMNAWMGRWPIGFI